MSNVHIVGVSANRINLINLTPPEDMTNVLGEKMNLPDLFTAKIEFNTKDTDLPGTEKESCHVLFMIPGAGTYPSVVQFFPELKEQLHLILNEDNFSKPSRVWMRDSTSTLPEHQTIVYADSASKRFYHKDQPEEIATPKSIEQTFTRNVKPGWPVGLSFTIFGKDHLDCVSFNIIYDVRAVNRPDLPSFGKIQFKGHVKDITESWLREIVLESVDISQALDYSAKETCEDLLVVATQVMLPDIAKKCSVALGSGFQVPPNYFLRINQEVQETLRIPPEMLLYDNQTQSWSTIDPVKLAEQIASAEALGINFYVKEVNNPPAPAIPTTGWKGHY